MGNSSSSSYSQYNTLKEIQKMIELETLIPTKTIDLTEEILNPFKHKYIIKLHSKNFSDAAIFLVFPNHPVQKKRTLCIQDYTSCNKLSIEINVRLQEQFGQKILLTAIGEHIYQITNITGKIYFLWAERINQQTINRQENTIEEDIPLIIETTGQYKERNIVQLRDGVCLNLQDVIIIEPFQYSLYCCETDNRKDQFQPIAVLSNSKADMITKDPVARTLVTMDKEEIPFSTSDEEGELKIIPNTERHISFKLKTEDGEFDEKQ